MNHVIIPKNRIDDFLDKMTKASIRVIAPVKSDGRTEFKELSSSKKIHLSDDITYNSPKEYFFPQYEMFLRFNENGEPEEVSYFQKTVIFGVHPCDLYSLKVLNEVFTKGTFKDTLFLGHKSNTVIIGLGCINEKPGCFCKESGLDKNSSIDCDLFLNDEGSYYLARVITDAGKALLDKFLPECDNVALDHEPALMDNVMRIIELDADEKELFEKVDWERISEACIGCGTCTFVCGTCHCFAFSDVTKNNKTMRYRCWDSCMFPKFTLHASGHNPRPSKKERFRQRILHKFLYIKENFGLTACSGCGRCIRSCPAGLNIRLVAKNIMEESK